MARTETPRIDAPFVLVADDDPVSLLVAQRMLEALGCRVATARDGHSAVRQAGEERFDLILMDCNMPGVDGLEATRRIRGGGERSCGTPIVAVTAGVEARECLDAGMDGRIVKPLGPEDVTRLYRTHLSSRAS